MFGLGKLVYVILLIVNGIAVLSEDRFLNRIGWGTSSNNNQFNQFDEASSIKTRLVNLIGAIRTLLRVPLIIVNVVVILYQLVLG